MVKSKQKHPDHVLIHHQSQQYDRPFVEHWDRWIDFDSRARAEGDRFIQLLREHNKKEVLDVATGTGFHSILLHEAGFHVVSADRCPTMLVHAFENAQQRGQILRTVQTDWRWLTRDVHERFDAVVCLGNSFTDLFDENDQRKALAEFYAALEHDGVLILDQRNYDVLLDHRGQTHEHRYYGQANVEAWPDHVDHSLVGFRYRFPDGEVFDLNMCPVRKHRMRQLILDAGFQHVTTHHDAPGQDEARSSFFIHLAQKA